MTCRQTDSPSFPMIDDDPCPPVLAIARLDAMTPHFRLLADVCLDAHAPCGECAQVERAVRARPVAVATQPRREPALVQL